MIKLTMEIHTEEEEEEAEDITEEEEDVDVITNLTEISLIETPQG